MCATKSCTTATWSRACAPKARFSSRNSSEVPDTGAPVIFSAHGVPRAVPEEAARRNLFALDATCPLVTKVHREAEIHHRRGREIVLIGHAGHPEVIGTMGQLPAGAITLIADPRPTPKLSRRATPTISLT